MQLYKVGVIGCGYWGPNLARNVTNNPRTALTAVFDVQKERAEALARKLGRGTAVAGREELINMVDVVIVATPVATHFDVAASALEAGKHVILTKPSVTTITQLEALHALAKKSQLTVVVDHTFIYSSAVREIARLVRNGDIGEVYYFDSTRINLGAFQPDVNVLWDLAVHDLSIMQQVIPSRVETVCAVTAANIPGERENVGYLTCKHENGAISHIHVNWLAPAKIRRTIVGGSRKMIVYDDLAADEKIKIYDKGVEVGERLGGVGTALSYRVGGIYCPLVPEREPLAVELEEFIRLVDSRAAGIHSFESVSDLTKILVASDESAKRLGAPVHL